MFDKLGKIASSAGNVMDAGVDKVHEVLREFNETMPTIKALGLSVRNISFGMGLVPEVSATLIGSIDALEQDKIDDLLKKHQDNRTTTLILEALKTASNLKDQLGDLGMRGVKVDVKLGLPPKIEVGLLPKAPTAES
ncbi:MAG TPA: hypothetical protein VL524_14110 [Gemmatimonadaceae bacterium]|nr:hypothetical protein [Gemmatimonadaceae bacterium]